VRKASLLLMIVLLSLGSCLSAQEPIYWEDAPTVQWNVPTVAPDGSPFLIGDVVRYDLFTWDRSRGEMHEQRIEALELQVSWMDSDPTVSSLDEFGEYEEAQVSLPGRAEYQVAVRATHIDGGGNETVYALPDGIPVILYSSRAEDTASGVAFWVVPGVGEPTGGNGFARLRHGAE